MPLTSDFYKTYKEESGKNQFDIKELDDTIYVSPTIAISSRNREGGSNVKQYGGGDKKTTQLDYDDSFCRLLYQLSPVYLVDECLNYHYSNYQTNRNGQIFLNHMKYVIKPKVLNPQIAEIFEEWLKKKNVLNMKKQLQEKNQYLERAYEAACEYYPNNPTSVFHDPILIGNEIGFDEITIERVVNELIEEGYLRGDIGLTVIAITRSGVEYLRTISESTKTEPLGIHFNVGNNSNVQFQQGTNNSSQTLSIDGQDEQSILQAMSELKVNINELRNYLSEDDVETILNDSSYIIDNFTRKNVNRSIFDSMLNGIKDVLKAVPSSVIANIITNPAIFS